MIKERVLIADDEDSSQKLLLSLLESYPDFCV
jgi:CheY-like chemotaxis protein